MGQLTDAKMRPEFRGEEPVAPPRSRRSPHRTVRVVNVLALCQILCTSMSTPKSQSDSPFRRLVRSLSRSSPRSERPPRPQGPDSPPAVPTPNKRYDDIARYAPGAGSPRMESPPSSAALSTSPPPGEPSASEPSWRWGGGIQTSLAVKEVPARLRTACIGTSSANDTYLPPPIAYSALERAEHRRLKQQRTAWVRVGVYRAAADSPMTAYRQLLSTASLLSPARQRGERTRTPPRHDRCPVRLRGFLWRRRDDRSYLLLRLS